MRTDAVYKARSRVEPWTAAPPVVFCPTRQRGVSRFLRGRAYNVAPVRLCFSSLLSRPDGFVLHRLMDLSCICTLR